MFPNILLLIGISTLFIISGANVNQFGALHMFLYSNWITCDHNKDLNLNIGEIQVFFYDFKNNYNLSSPIEEAASLITSAYHLDITRRLIIFVPGYKSHISRKTEDLIRTTFRDVPDVYLIIIDHSAYTSASDGKWKSYERSVLYTYYIGRAIGYFLADLKDKGIASNNIHTVGHSLGSQMLAHAGEAYTNRTSEKIWRITGLDPAGPCFSNALTGVQLRSGVAQYVEVYHCNAGALGSTSVLADTDFFFNEEGARQPACDAAKCSHKACVRYWAASVRRPGSFLAWRCDSYAHFNAGRCAGNEVTIAGYSNPGNATGVFYVSTDGYGL